MCGRFILKSVSRVPFFLELTSPSLTSSKIEQKMSHMMKVTVPQRLQFII